MNIPVSGQSSLDMTDDGLKEELAELSADKLGSLADSAERTLAERASRPDWLPENFNDGEALAKSWKDTKAALTRAEQRAAELAAQTEAYEELLAAAYATEPQQDTSYVPQPQATSGIFDAVHAGIAEGSQHPNERGERLAAEAENILASTLPDWPSLRESVYGVIQESPEFLEGVTSGADVAVRLASVARLVQQGQQQVQRYQKMQAQTMTGRSSGRTASGGDFNEQYLEFFKANKPTMYGTP